MKLTKVVML